MNTEIARTVEGIIRTGAASNGFLPALGPVVSAFAPYLIDYGIQSLEKIMENHYRVRIGPFSLEPADTTS